MTTVINIKNAPDGWQDNSDYVYIGRWNKHYGVQKSKWHNPIKLSSVGNGKDNTGNREHCLKLYTRYLMRNIDLITALSELKDKTLVCYCHPQHCHGHVLATLADRSLWKGEQTVSADSLFNRQSLPDVDDIANRIAAYVMRITKSLSGYDDTVSDYDSLLAEEKVLESVYDAIRNVANDYEQRRARLKAKHDYEKAQAERVRVGGQLWGTNADVSRMRDMLNTELLAWKVLWQSGALHPVTSIDDKTFYQFSKLTA